MAKPNGHGGAAGPRLAGAARRTAALALLLARLSPVSTRPHQHGDPPPSAASATVLLYHRFGPVVAGATTVRATVFERQVEFLRDNGYTLVALRDIVNFVMGRGRRLQAPGALRLDRSFQ